MKKSKICLIVLVAILGVLLSGALGGILALELVGGPEPQQGVVPVGDEVIVYTPYCTLSYPDTWGGEMQTECVSQEPYTLRFLGTVGTHSRVPLFDLLFNGAEGAYFATFLLETEQPVNVQIVYHEIDTAGWEEADAAKIRQMQRSLQDVTLRAPLSYFEGAKKPEHNVTVSETGELIINTPYGELTTSTPWEEYLGVKCVEGTPYQVEFWCELPGKEAVHLFTVAFGEVEDEAETIGTIDGRPVTVFIPGFIPDETWSEADQTIVMELSEEINQITQQVMELDGFEFPEE